MATSKQAHLSASSAALSSADPAIMDFRQSAAVIRRLLEEQNYADHLGLLTEQLAMMIGASGAAIALRTGPGSPVVCVESWGMAPPKGVVVSESAGLCGECLRKGVVVRCDDATLDTRVSKPTALASVLAVPVGRTPRVEGLIVAFSGEPYVFSGSATDLLTFSADVLALSIAKKQKGPQLQVVTPIVRPLRPTQAQPSAAKPIELPTLTEYDAGNWAATIVEAARHLWKRYKEEIRLGIVVVVAGAALAGFIVAADQRNSALDHRTRQPVVSTDK